jgi:hypothetical protein
MTTIEKIEAAAFVLAAILWVPLMVGAVIYFFL